MAEHSNGRSPAGMWVFPQADQITAQVMERTTRRCKPYTIALVVAALLAALGVVGFLLRVAADGLDNYNAWGYYMAAFSFVFMVTSGAPLATAAFRFTKSHWRRPLSRVAELFAVVENHDHRGLTVHLFQIVERLGIRVFGGSRAAPTVRTVAGRFSTVSFGCAAATAATSWRSESLFYLS